MASSATKFLCLFIIAGLAVPSLATDYIVGDSLGWCPAGNLPSWILGKTFYVGDCLHFNSPLSKPVSLYLVADLNAYLTCNLINAILIDATGSCAYTLIEQKTYYFIADRVNCLLGARLTVTALLL